VNLKTKTIVAAAALALGLPTLAAHAQSAAGSWRLASSPGAVSCYQFAPVVNVGEPSGATINKSVGWIRASDMHSGATVQVYDTAASTPSGAPAYAQQCDGDACEITPPSGGTFSFQNGLLVCASPLVASNGAPVDEATYETGASGLFQIAYQ
jgi:hypothetical protein